MAKLEKKFIEEAREFMNEQLDNGEYCKGSKYLETIKAKLPREVYHSYREMFDMKLNPDKSQIHHSRIL